MSVMDWTGGLIRGQDVPISLMRLPSRVHYLDPDEPEPIPKKSGRRPESLMARVKKLIERHGKLSTRELQELLPNEPAKAVAVACRNLVRLKELRQAGQERRKGRYGSGCAIWEVRG